MKQFKAVLKNEQSYIGIKTFTVAKKHEVHVHHIKIRQANGLPAIKISAVIGDYIEEHIWNVGEYVDLKHPEGAMRLGQRPEPDTVEQLQAKLDDLRERVAVEAAWKEENHQNVQKLV